MKNKFILFYKKILLFREKLKKEITCTCGEYNIEIRISISD